MDSGALPTPALSFIDAAGARIAVRRSGQGPAVVCVHAIGHDGRDFDRLAQSLGAEFEFIALDWPGQGESPHEAIPTSARRYGEILAGAVATLGLDRFLLIGNSIGGAAAILYAAAHPARVHALVLCNTGGLFPVNALVRFYCRRLARKFARGASGDPGFQRWFARYYHGVLPQPAAHWRRDEIIASGPRIAGVLNEAWRSFAEPDADIRALVPALSMPVLYAWARRDRALPWAFVKATALKAPHPEIALFDAGHAAFLEQPDAFAATFRRFVARV